MAGPFLPANGAPSPNPIHILSQEQARCMIAIKELHSQVAVLLQFRNEVLKSLPQLDQKHQRVPVLGTSAAEISNGPSTTLQHHDEAFVTSHPTPLKLPNKTRPRLQVPNQTQPKTPSTPGMMVPPNPSGVGVGTHRMPRRTDRARWGPTVKFLVVAQGRNWMRVRPCAPRTTKGGAEDSDDCYDDGELDDEEDEMRCTSDELRSVVMAAKTKDRSRESRDKGPARHHQKDSGFSTDTRPVETGSEKPRRRNAKLENDDELLRLLDDIEKKGSGLRKRVDDLESEPKVEDRGARGSLADIGLNAHEVLAEMEKLHRERDQLVDRLAEAATARDQDRLRLQELANAALDVQAVNRRLEARLLKQTIAEAGSRVDMMAYSEGALADVDRCASRDVHWKPCGAKAPACSLPLRLHVPKEPVNSKCGTKVRVRPDRERVSAILRESRVLELQRQLLVAVFENEVLKSRLSSSQARKVPQDVGAMDRGSRMSSSSSPYGEALRQLSVENVPVERTRLRSSVDLLNTSSTPSSQASTISRSQSRAVPETPTCSCCREEVSVRNKGHFAQDPYGIQTYSSRDENTMGRFMPPRYDIDYRTINEPRSTNRAPNPRTSEAFVSSDHGNKAHSRHVCNGRIYNCGSA